MGEIHALIELNFYTSSWRVGSRDARKLKERDMPIVFIHGVNNRVEDKDYAPGVNSKREFLQKTFAPRVGMSVESQNVMFPYWGGQGVDFRWKQASLPRASDDVVALGKNDTALELWLGEVRFQRGSDTVSLGEVSRNEGFVVAIDILWDTASVAAPNDRTQEIASYYEASLKYAEVDPAPAWALAIPSLDNEKFAQKLLEEIAPHLQKSPDAPVALGIGDWFASVREAIRRLEKAPGDAASAILAKLGRKSTHESASRFLGDIFIYLTTRDKTGPDSILSDVLAKLKEADAARTQGDDKLVVIGHSLGGLLAYDAFTYYLPDIKVDYFITVGSQVALFEEMTLCKISQQGIPKNPPSDRLPKPLNVGRWINVYDTNDVFSFRAEGVFLATEDYKFDTGYGLLGAHGGYFLSPSFYKRLAKRIQA